MLDRLSLVGFVLFFVAPKAFREESDRHILLGTLVALGAYLGLTALFETVGPDALVVPDYISDPSVGTHRIARAARSPRPRRTVLSCTRAWWPRSSPR